MHADNLRVAPILSRIGPVLCLLLATIVAAAPTGTEEEAKQIAALTGFHGGLVIHVGCGDGKLTAVLRLADNCVVQGLDANAKIVDAARAVIRSLGLYGPVSVMRWSGKKLPYVDNLATLVVCEAGRCVSATHVAAMNIKVQKTTGQMGLAVGAAAFLCKKQNTTPRGVYEKHLAELQDIVFERGEHANDLRLAKDLQEKER